MKIDEKLATVENVDGSKPPYEVLSYKLYRDEDGRAHAIVQWYCEKCKCLHERQEIYSAANFRRVGYYLNGGCNQFVDVNMPWFNKAEEKQ